MQYHFLCQTLLCLAKRAIRGHCCAADQSMCMKHQTHSDYHLFKKHSRLFLILQIKHGGGCHTQRNTRANLFDRKVGMTLTCVCVSVYVYTRMVLLGGFLPACSSIYLSVCVCQSHYVRCASVLNLDSICRVFSVCFPLLWLGTHSSFSASSVKPHYPKYCEIS